MVDPVMTTRSAGDTPAGKLALLKAKMAAAKKTKTACSKYFMVLKDHTLEIGEPVIVECDGDKAENWKTIQPIVQGIKGGASPKSFKTKDEAAIAATTFYNSNKANKKEHLKVGKVTSLTFDDLCEMLNTPDEADPEKNEEEEEDEEDDEVVVTDMPAVTTGAPLSPPSPPSPPSPLIAINNKRWAVVAATTPPTWT